VDSPSPTVDSVCNYDCADGTHPILPLTATQRDSCVQELLDFADSEPLCP
jgi:hypothetical protein